MAHPNLLYFPTWYSSSLTCSIQSTSLPSSLLNGDSGPSGFLMVIRQHNRSAGLGERLRGRHAYARAGSSYEADLFSNDKFMNGFLIPELPAYAFLHAGISLPRTPRTLLMFSPLHTGRLQAGHFLQGASTRMAQSGWAVSRSFRMIAYSCRCTRFRVLLIHFALL
jgi:hypothetical protein